MPLGRQQTLRRSMVPIREYECMKCHKVFEVLERSPKPAKAPECPECHGTKVTQRFSTFAGQGLGAVGCGPAPGGG